MINETKLDEMQVEAEAKVQKLWDTFMQQFSSPPPGVVKPEMLPKPIQPLMPEG